MNIYVGISPVVHLIQCVFHSHFPLIYFIPWAPIGNNLSWLCLPSICHKESQLLLPALQWPIFIKCKPQKSSPASLCPYFPVQQSISGSSTASLGFRVKLCRGEKTPAYGMRQKQEVTSGSSRLHLHISCHWHRSASGEACLRNISILGYLKLHKENR